MKEIEYGHISLLLETWEEARFRTKNFDESFGREVLKKLFALQPRAKKAFGCEEAIDVENRAQIHVIAFADMFDTVFQMLGVDLDFISNILEQIATRHKALGVNPCFFAYLGKALISTVEQFLGRPLTEEERDAWDEIYDSISEEITKTILS